MNRNVGWIALAVLSAIIAVPALAGIGKAFFKLAYAAAFSSAIDAGFMALLALLSSVVAFQATDDFLDHVSTIKIFAIAAVAYAILKGLMIIPIRTAKWLSAALTLAIFLLSMAFLIHRHDLAHPNALLRFAAAVQLLNFPRVIATLFIATLSFLSLTYPFTPTRWKRLWQ